MCDIDEYPDHMSVCLGGGQFSVHSFGSTWTLICTQNEAAHSDRRTNTHTVTASKLSFIKK